MRYPILLTLFTIICHSSVIAGERLLPLLEIEDGDTLIVQIDGKPTRIQLTGIDAPEDSDNAKLQHDSKRTTLAAEALLPLGRSATAHLKALLAGQSQVILNSDLAPADRYGRIPAEVKSSAGESLSERMVGDGYAIVLRKIPLDAASRQRLLASEEAARQTRQGLWGAAPQTMLRWSGND